MSKSLVTLLGLVMSLGVIALGFFLVALPLFVQATAVDAQTTTVANTNAIYQAQVDGLRAQEESLPEIQASVDGLREQIPATGQFDDVFEVIGRAADASDVLLTSITAGESTAFAPRTGAEEGGEAAVVAEADPASEATDGAVPTTEPTTEGTVAPAVPAVDTRQQVDFVIAAAASSMEQATEFVDRLRAGPRLLNSVTATTSRSGGGEITVQVTALTYVEAER